MQPRGGPVQEPQGEERPHVQAGAARRRQRDGQVWLGRGQDPRLRHRQRGPDAEHVAEVRLERRLPEVGPRRLGRHRVPQVNF